MIKSTQSKKKARCSCERAFDGNVVALAAVLVIAVSVPSRSIVSQWEQCNMHATDVTAWLKLHLMQAPFIRLVRRGADHTGR